MMMTTNATPNNTAPTNMPKSTNHTPVLIVGAGPTGMVLALWLTAQGIKVRIIDKTPTTGTQSRALAVHARTLELYQQMGLTEQVIADGFQSHGVNIWSQGKRRAHLDLASFIDDHTAPPTAYPFILIYPQDKHEKLLEQTLQQHGVTVERNTELVEFLDKDNQITATLRLPTGETQTVTADFLAGCDGARSIVRQSLHADFDGGTYKQLFYVADVELADNPLAGQISIALEKSDFMLVMPYDDHNRVRLVGTIVPEQMAKPVDQLTFSDVGQTAISDMGFKIQQVNWFSTYHVHHRVTQNFRHGRVFLLGDAAHIHSPAGGQGMNTGIGDAINLAWKLAMVLKNQAPDSLLTTVDSERASFAHTLVNTTDKLFSFVTKEGEITEFLRTYIAPNVAKIGWQMAVVKEKVFDTVSQIKVNYRDSELSAGKAGEVQGGDRLPYVVWQDDGHTIDNYPSLRHIAWQVHVYGEPTFPLQAWCEKHGIPLTQFTWQDAFEKAGLAKNAAYLLRPDSYVAVADKHGSATAFENYFIRQQFYLSGLISEH